MVLRLHLGDFAEALIERGLKFGDVRLEFGELGGEGEILLLDEKAVLLGVDVGGVGLGADGVELVEEAADEGVGLRGHGRAVTGAPRELLVGEEERHRVCPNRREFERDSERKKEERESKREMEKRERRKEERNLKNKRKIIERSENR